MITVHFRNTTKTHLPAEPFLATVGKVLKKYGITDNVEVELKIVGQTKMRQLNSTYRHKDYATDVLSFPIWPNLKTITERLQDSVINLGSIVICLPVAIRDAQHGDETLDQKLHFLIEHSLLHLMGFHHEGDT
jgi:probable rRNA maturation factor